MSVQHEDIRILNIYELLIEFKIQKAKPFRTKMKNRQIHNPPGEFKTPTLNDTNNRQKISKDTENLTTAISQHDLIGITDYFTQQSHKIHSFHVNMVHL